jgi:hypothetical protein
MKIQKEKGCNEAGIFLDTPPLLTENSDERFGGLAGFQISTFPHLHIHLFSL